VRVKEAGGVRTRGAPAGGAEQAQPSSSVDGRCVRVTVLTLLLAVTAGGLYLRLDYALSTSPYIDEYTTMWVALRTIDHGYPVFSTGAIYAQGLLFTYLDALFLWLFSFSEFAARIPSVIIGVSTIASAYLVGKKMFSARQGLLVAALVALAPQAVVWGGRARNYALIQLIVLWAAYLFYRWAISAEGDRFGWLFVLAFSAAVFTHNVAMLLYPAFLICAFLRQGWRWFLRRNVILANLVLFVAVAASLYLYRRLRPPGWGEVGEGRLEIGVSFNLLGAIERYRPFFLGLDDLPFAGLLTVLCAVAVGYVLLRAARARSVATVLGPSNELAPLAYLSLLFALIVLEMFFVVNERRWSPRYFFIEAPLFYLIAVNLLSRMASSAERWLAKHMLLDRALGGPRKPAFRLAVTSSTLALIALISWPAATAVIAKGEYGYDRAFQYLRENRLAGDRVMTFAVSPCALYLGEDGCSYVAIEKDFHSYATQREGSWIEAWAGVPILFTDTDLMGAIEGSSRTWFVVDESRFRTRYSHEFIQYVWDRMDLVAKEGGVFVFLSQSPAPAPLAIQRSVHYNLGGEVALLGYGLSSTEPRTGDTLELSLRWEGLTHILRSYSAFVHLVDRQGRMWAQDDGAPLLGLHPTTHWVEGEIISDPRTLALPEDMPPGRYRIQTGMYVPETMERLPVFAADLEPLGDVAILDFVQVGGSPGAARRPEHDANFELGGEVTLWGYDVEAVESEPGGRLYLSLYWRADRTMDEDYTVFVHVIDAEGRIWGQQDNQPEGGFYPTSFWDVGEAVRDDYGFDIDPAAPSGEYRIEVGMYLLDTGQRLPVIENGVRTAGDSALLGTVVLSG
jgi:4-amino-4-deoxy-L-arabinose transferase-like glycosyltransferase